MGQPPISRHFGSKILNFIGIFVFIALVACGGGLGGGSVGGVGSVGGGAGGTGGALDGSSGTGTNLGGGDTAQSPGLDHDAVGPYVDYSLKVAVANCMQGKCNIPVDIDLQDEQQPEWDGCYEIEFDATFTLASGDSFANKTVRVVDHTTNIYRDFKTDASGKAHLALEIKPVTHYEFYDPSLTDPPNLAWNSCTADSCSSPPLQKFVKDFQPSCEFLHTQDTNRRNKLKFPTTYLHPLQSND